MKCPCCGGELGWRYGGVSTECGWEWGYCTCGFPVYRCVRCGSVFPAEYDLDESGVARRDAAGFEVEVTSHECGVSGC